MRDQESNDLVGYFGDDPGDPLIVPAGSIACFSTTLFHRSGPNTTNRMRRVYVAPYSAEPILIEEGSQPRMLAEPSWSTAGAGADHASRSPPIKATTQIEPTRESSQLAARSRITSNNARR